MRGTSDHKHIFDPNHYDGKECVICHEKYTTMRDRLLHILDKSIALDEVFENGTHIYKFNKAEAVAEIEELLRDHDINIDQQSQSKLFCDHDFTGTDDKGFTICKKCGEGYT